MTPERPLEGKAPLAGVCKARHPVTSEHCVLSLLERGGHLVHESRTGTRWMNKGISKTARRAARLPPPSGGSLAPPA